MTQQQIIKRPNRTRNQGLDLRSPPLPFCAVMNRGKAGWPRRNR